MTDDVEKIAADDVIEAMARAMMYYGRPDLECVNYFDITAEEERNHYRDIAQAALAAAHSAGFVLAPVEATPEMLKAGNDTGPRGLAPYGDERYYLCSDEIASIYNAMISAGAVIPSPPRPAEPIGEGEQAERAER